MGLTKEVPCFVSSRNPNYIQLLGAHVHWSAKRSTCLPLAGTLSLIFSLPLIIFIFLSMVQWCRSWNSCRAMVQWCLQPVGTPVTGRTALV